MFTNNNAMHEARLDADSVCSPHPEADGVVQSITNKFFATGLTVHQVCSIIKRIYWIGLGNNDRIGTIFSDLFRIFLDYR